MLITPLRASLTLCLVGAMFIGLLCLPSACVTDTANLDASLGQEVGDAEVQDGPSETSNGKCATLADCADFTGSCFSDTRCEDGRCAYSVLPFGSIDPKTPQIYGDCVSLACDGFGKLTTMRDELDVPDDRDPCTYDFCVDGMPHAIHPPTNEGGACGDGGTCKAGVCQ